MRIPRIRSCHRRGRLTFGFLGIGAGLGGWQMQTQFAAPTFALNSAASFTGVISGNMLTISSVTGTVATGQYLTGSGIPAFTEIISGSGTTWTTNGASLSISSEATTAMPPCTSTSSTGTNGTVIDVTGSVSGKWSARCNGTNWIEPDGSTINYLIAPLLLNFHYVNVREC
jgi:hypothetical protein